MSYLGEEIKKLGFGCMRLPRNADGIDIEQTKEMVDLFMGAGFTYFDTARVYGGSEEAVRKALVERYPRESYQLATKIAPWFKSNSKEEATAQLAQSLETTQAGYFDYYLLHNVAPERKQIIDKYDLWSWMQEQKANGLVKHIGFSFHSTPEDLDEILTDHPEMEFVQLQINYADWDFPSIQSRRCYEIARKHGKPVIIMEPVKGGILANPPQPVANILKNAEPHMSPASWAVRFAADLEGVITVLSGMSNLEQMQDNLSYMKDFTSLTLAQKHTLDEAREAISKVPMIPCTNCNYCAKVCPMNICISASFTAMNNLARYNNTEQAKRQLEWQVTGLGHKPATECIKCGLCEGVCPQHIEIRKELERVAATF